MKRRIIALHGWRVRDGGKRSLGPLLDALRGLGYDVVAPSYGYVLTPWKTRNESRKAAKLLSSRIGPGDVLLGHSNGGRIAWELSFYAPAVEMMVLLNPALDSDCVPARTVRQCLVVHNRRDIATRAAGLIPGSIWGDMGRVGYAPSKKDPFGADARMRNLPLGKGHSPYKKDPELWAKLIDDFLRFRELGVS